MVVDEIQELLDSGKSMTSISAQLGIHHETLRRFIDRNKLDIYESFGVNPYSIPIQDVKDSIYIDDSYKVVFDECKLRELSTICGVSIGSLKSAVKLYKDSVEMDALDEFVRSFDFDEINNEAITGNRHIVHYISKHCGSFNDFREMFGIDFNIISYASDQSRSYFINAGRKFEQLVGDVLKEIHEKVDEGYYVDGCFPDFVIGDCWLDAKLSKSTAFSPSCKTIEKYSVHTKNLAIIYCIDDIDEIPNKYEDVDFVHITDLYPYISDELITDISELKAEVKHRKAGGGFI